MAATMVEVPGQGLFLFGAFLSVTDQEPYKKRDGSEGMSWAKVKLLVGDSVLVVEYPTLADVPESVALAQRDEPVILGVYARGPWADGRPGRVSFNGATRT